MSKLITSLSEYIKEETTNGIWYHGTPDSRGIEKNGFDKRTKSITYLKDIEKYKEAQSKLKSARENDDMDLYHRILDTISYFKSDMTYNSPIFLTDNYSVARTYADPMRAFDYQGAIEKVYKVRVNNCNRVVRINATGDRFRFISVDKVKRGFMAFGITEEEITDLINKFNFYVQNNKGVQTDVIAAIGNCLKIDCIDVIGVYDSYNGGKIKSTVRMVLDPSNIEIV